MEMEMPQQLNKHVPKSVRKGMRKCPHCKKALNIHEIEDRWAFIVNGVYAHIANLQSQLNEKDLEIARLRTGILNVFASKSSGAEN